MYLRGDPTSAEIKTTLADYEQSSSRSVSVTLPDGTVLGKMQTAVQGDAGRW